MADPTEGRRWGAYYALEALALGEVAEARAILEAVVDGKWDDHSGDGDPAAAARVAVRGAGTEEAST